MNKHDYLNFLQPFIKEQMTNFDNSQIFINFKNGMQCTIDFTTDNLYIINKMFENIYIYDIIEKIKGNGNNLADFLDLLCLLNFCSEDELQVLKDVIYLTDCWLDSYNILTCSLHHFTISIHNHKDIEDLTILLPALQKIAFTDKIT